jgi:hypothetical protein
LGNLPGLPILCAAKMDSFLLVTDTERTVFTIYQKKLFFLTFLPEINQYIHKTKIVISNPHINRWTLPSLCPD